MFVEQLFREIKEFSKETHGSSSYDKDEVFVMGQNESEFAPLKYLEKKITTISECSDIMREGFVCDSLELADLKGFQSWFERQFSRKMTMVISKNITILHYPNNKSIFDAIEQVNKSYEILKQYKVLLNNKKFPVQLGEWYAKLIFGLRQFKSPSQRGFDFELQDERVEVKVHWSDFSSPKGVKLRKSLVELSDFCIIMYIARNFMIREICFLDSDFVLRKFAGKGHTVFLKDSDVSQYFFSNSNHQAKRVVNTSALMKYASPTFAMKIAEKF